jgi:hypothetical protein
LFYERQLAKHIEDADMEVEAQIQRRQILITSSAILCESIRKQYRNLCETEEPREDIDPDDPNNDSDTAAESDVETDDVIQYSQLTDPEFPVICTYSTLLMMIDQSLPVSFFGRGITLSREVTFERFESHYALHFTQELDCSASLVYTEIISRIKGSIPALHSPSGWYLSEEQYIALGELRDSTVTNTAQRRVIYSTFKKYERMKNDNHDYDLLDIVHYCYRALQQHSLPQVSSVYVDEVQDLTPAQIALFKFVCRNPNGYLFAGDTAQTVLFFSYPLSLSLRIS